MTDGHLSAHSCRNEVCDSFSASVEYEREIKTLRSLRYLRAKTKRFYHTKRLQRTQEIA